MSDQDERQVRITGADIEAAGEKLRGFKQTLAPGEQAVIDWLLQRASEAPVADEEVSGYGFRNLPSGPINPTVSEQRGTAGVSPGFGHDPAQPSEPRTKGRY